MGRSYKVICAVTIVFLCIAVWLIGGIPTDSEDIILIFSCIYFPLLFPILISIAGMKTNIGLYDIKKIRVFVILSLIYNFLAVPVIWWIVAHWNFGLALVTFFNIVGVEFLSLIIHLYLVMDANEKYKTLKGKMQADRKEEETPERKRIYSEIIVLSAVILLVAAAVFAERWIARLILVKEIEKEPPIILSAYFDSDNKGTYMYYLGNQGLIKISDHIFYSPSYNEDRTKIVGVIEEENGFNGIGELDFSDNSFREVLNLEEINEFAKNNGLDGFDLSDEYLDVGDRIRVAKYYKNSYTFIYDGNICMLSGKEGDKQIKIIRKKKRGSYVDSYYIDKKNNNILYIETRQYNDDRKKKTIVKENTGNKSSEILTTIIPYEYEKEDHDGVMEMSDDMQQLFYYKSSHIYSYDVDSSVNKYIARHKLNTRDILDLRLSKDKQYLFYTIVDRDMFSSYDQQYAFCVVDLKSRSRVYLKRWELNQNFYGFDW